MIAVEKQADTKVKIPVLDTDDRILVDRVKGKTAVHATIAEFLSFVTRRRRMIDALVKEVYPEWPA